MKKLVLALILAFACVFSTSCGIINPISPITQIGIMWIEGEAHKYYNTDRETIYKAVKNVLAELDLPITEEEDKGDYIYIVADAGDRFKIKIREVRENITKLSIRVNIMGDKPYAELIYRHVDRQPGVMDFYSVEELNKALQTRKRVLR